MEGNCIKSVVPFSILEEWGCSEILTKLFVNPRKDGEMEMCAVEGNTLLLWSYHFSQKGQHRLPLQRVEVLLQYLAKRQ